MTFDLTDATDGCTVLTVVFDFDTIPSHEEDCRDWFVQFREVDRSYSIVDIISSNLMAIDRICLQLPVWRKFL